MALFSTRRINFESIVLSSRKKTLTPLNHSTSLSSLSLILSFPFTHIYQISDLLQQYVPAYCPQQTMNTHTERDSVGLSHYPESQKICQSSYIKIFKAILRKCVITCTVFQPHLMIYLSGSSLLSSHGDGSVVNI